MSPRKPRKVYTKVEEYELIALAQKGDRKAMDKLVETNYGLLVHIAKLLQNADGRAREIPLDDLAQIGVVGIYKAVRKFNLQHESSPRFATYAVWWIRSIMQRVLQGWTSIIFVPEKTTESIRNVHRLEYEARQRGAHLSTQEIAEKLGLSQTYLDDLMHTAIPRTVSLDMPLGTQEDALHLSEVIADISQDSVLDECMRRELVSRIQVAMQELSTMEFAILHFRFFRDMTLHEAGEALAPLRKDRLGISREGARQLQKKALLKLKDLLESAYKK